MLDDALGVLGHSLGEGLGLQSARMTGVMVVDLVQLLRAGHANLVRVDDDHEVAGVHVRRVLRLVLALQKGSGLGGNTAEDLILSVDDVPFALNFMRLSVIRLHCFSSMSFLLRCATTAHRVSFFKSASLYAAGFLRRRASSGLDFPSWRCLHLAFTGLLKANFCSLRFQPLRSQWGMCAHLGLLRDFHTDCTNAASKPPRHRPPARLLARCVTSHHALPPPADPLLNRCVCLRR